MRWLVDISLVIAPSLPSSVSDKPRTWGGRNGIALILYSAQPQRFQS